MRVSVIGCGNMGAALVKGLARALPSLNLMLCNRSTEKLTKLCAELEAHTTNIHQTQDIDKAILGADLVFLAVKPWDILPILGSVKQPALFVSLAAGVPLCDLEKHAPAGSRLMRAMPNTAVASLVGTTAYIRGKHATAEDAALCHQLLAPLGLAIELQDESQIHALIALAGSSPAYFYELLDAMQQVGEQMGLSRELSLQLASSAMRGAASLQLETQQDPKTLRNAVTSPNGVTLFALRRLNALDIKNSWQDVCRAAQTRSQEMEANQD